MNTLLNFGAKRLLFSLLVAGSLGGCAVYQPVASRAPDNWDDGEWQTVEETPVYAAPSYVEPWYGVPYLYGVPSIAFGLGFYSGRGWHGGGNHWHGGRGFGRGHGGRR